MNVFQKAIQWIYQKAVGFPPWNAAGPWPQSVIEGFAGGSYTADQLSTIWGCIRVRGQTLGSLPCNVYRVAPDGHKTPATDHWLWPLVHEQPNRYQSSFEFFENLERSFCLWGNAYAHITRIGKRVVALDFLIPDAVNVRWDFTRREPVYTYSWQNIFEEYGPDEILHIKNFSSNGIWGDSPIRSKAIVHAIAAQDYGTYFLSNLGRPSGYLAMPGKRPANEEAANKLRQDWQGIHGGTQNAGKTGVLWDGAKYEPLSIAPDEAQYIETRRLSNEEIAGAIYGVPLNLIGQSDKTATYASAEQFDLSYTKHTVRPQARRYEAAIKHALLQREPGVICEFDLDELQRGDMAAQIAAAASQVQNGIAARNEVRPKFNLPPSKQAGADDLTVQVNQTPLDQLGKVTAANLAQPPSQQPPKPQPGGTQP